MNVPEACERALRDGLIAAGITGTFRCFRLDDVTIEATEPTASTIIGIMASPDVARGYQDPARTVPIYLMLTTYYADDPKHATLTALETAIRDNLEAEGFASQFAGTGVTFNAVIFGDSPPPIVDMQTSSIELSIELYVCAAWAT